MRRRCAFAGVGLVLLAGSPAAPADAPRLDLLTAVRMTLERDPNVAVAEARLESARGGLLAEQGAFDTVVRADATAEDSRSPEAEGGESEVRTVSSTLGLTSPLRSGLTFEPEISLRQTADRDSAAEPVNEGTVSFRIRQPLLAGRGREATTARERAAEQELAAAALDLEQRIADRLLAVVDRYWRWVAAERNLAVFRESEDRSRALLEKTRVLIAADQVPAAELVQLEANLASQESATLGGLQEAFSARQELGREIGLEAGEIAALPAPGDTFPEVRSEAVPEATTAGRWIGEALARRADHRAAQARIEAAEIRRRAAFVDLRPVLDLVFTPSWSGRDVGSGGSPFFAPLTTNVPGASATLGLSFRWPVANTRAEGALVQAEASARQSELAREIVAKAIGADVPAALDRLEKSVQRLAKARVAVGLFERAVINEEKKLRAGTSTLLDLISQQDRLTAARQSVVAAELAVAQAVARLRFETGTLGSGGQVSAADFTTVPVAPQEVSP